MIVEFKSFSYVCNHRINHHGQWYIKEHGQRQFPAIDEGYDHAYKDIACDGQKMSKIFGHASAYFLHVAVEID